MSNPHCNTEDAHWGSTITLRQLISAPKNRILKSDFFFGIAADVPNKNRNVPKYCSKLCLKMGYTPSRWPFAIEDDY